MQDRINLSSNFGKQKINNNKKNKKNCLSKKIRLKIAGIGCQGSNQDNY